jgi:hypothetical protein
MSWFSSPSADQTALERCPIFSLLLTAGTGESGNSRGLSRSSKSFIYCSIVLILTDFDCKFLGLVLFLFCHRYI